MLTCPVAEYVLLPPTVTGVGSASGAVTVCLLFEARLPVNVKVDAVSEKVPVDDTVTAEFDSVALYDEEATVIELALILPPG